MSLTFDSEDDAEAVLRDIRAMVRHYSPLPTPSTAYTVAASIVNGEEVRSELAWRYPEEYRARGVGATVSLSLFVDIDGRVRDARVREGSGIAAFDRAALQVAKIMRFRPAKNDGEDVALWVSFPITFQVEGTSRSRQPS